MLIPTLAAAQSGSAQDLLSHYTVVTAGDYTAYGEWEGGALVGGNFYAGNSTQAGANYGTAPGQTLPADAALAVQGTVSGLGGQRYLNVQNGFDVIAGAGTGGNLSFNFNSGTAGRGGASGPGSLLTGASAWEELMVELGLPNGSIADALRISSGYYADLAGNSSVRQPAHTPGTLSFEATPGTVDGRERVAVFHVDGSIFSNSSYNQFQLAHNGAEAILINVSGTDINWNQPSNMTNGFNSSSDIGSILWNFHEARTVTLGSNFRGSILAPHAEVIATGSNIDGSVAAWSLSNRGEVHRGYGADLPDPTPIPEPGAAALALLPLMAGLGRRRRG